MTSLLLEFLFDQVISILRNQGVALQTVNGILALLASDKFLVLDTYFWEMLKVRSTEVGLKWKLKDNLENVSTCFVPLHSEE